MTMTSAGDTPSTLTGAAALASTTPQSENALTPRLISTVAATASSVPTPSIVTSGTFGTGARRRLSNSVSAANGTTSPNA